MHVQDTGAMGLSFPEPRSYITCHYRFPGRLAIKRRGVQAISARTQSQAKEQCEILHITASCCIWHLFFTPPWGFVWGIFFSLPLCFFPSHSGQSQGHGAGCRWHCACQVRLRLMNGTRWSEPSSSHFPSPPPHLPHFTPKQRHSGVERPAQSSPRGASSPLHCCHCSE